MFGRRLIPVPYNPSFMYLPPRLRLPQRTLGLLWLVIGGCGLSPLCDAQTPSIILYNRDVRPIFTDVCFACHGADSATREAGLRLDVRDEAIEMLAIVPGSIEESELVRRIKLGADDEMRMPPASSHKNLTPEQIDILTRWISQGAPYQPHWAFIPPTRPEIPTVEQAFSEVKADTSGEADADWGVNPIDAFVGSKLNSLGLTPAGRRPADIGSSGFARRDRLATRARVGR